MTYAPTDITGNFDTLPQLPAWVTSRGAETPEDLAFLSGAALSHLHHVLGHADVPQALLRQRFALRAAARCLAFTGRPEREAELRDAVAFLLPGDSPGPAGAVYQSWRRAVEGPASLKTIHHALSGIELDQIASLLDAGQGAPVSRATAVLEAGLENWPRDLPFALIVAEAALGQSLRWGSLSPLLAVGLKRGDLRKTGPDLRLACHQAIILAAREVTQDALRLSRSAVHLRAVAPKLRAKGAAAAVALFLTRDAVAATDLTSLRSDRAARRFCDRLVELGAARELTGRNTFRLYGLAF